MLNPQYPEHVPQSLSVVSHPFGSFATPQEYPCPAHHAASFGYDGQHFAGSHVGHVPQAYVPPHPSSAELQGLAAQAVTFGVGMHPHAFGSPAPSHVIGGTQWSGHVMWTPQLSTAGPHANPMHVLPRGSVMHGAPDDEEADTDDADEATDELLTALEDDACDEDSAELDAAAPPPVSPTLATLLPADDAVDAPPALATVEDDTPAPPVPASDEATGVDPQA